MAAVQTPFADWGGENLRRDDDQDDIEVGTKIPDENEASACLPPQSHAVREKKAWRGALACIFTGAATVLLLWLKPREVRRTVFGLSVGMACGYYAHSHYIQARHRKRTLQYLLSTEWHDWLEAKPIYKKHLKDSAYWARDMTRESMHWMNRMIKTMWPFYNQAICDAVISNLEPVLDAYKPSWMRGIYFRACTLGDNPFEVYGMTMIKEHDGSPIHDAIEFETDVRWNGDVNIKLAVSALASAKLCQIKIKDVCLVGRVRVLLTPLISKTPCFGSLSVSFVEPPSLDFNLVLTGALAFADPIERWLKPMVSSFIQDTYVWPKRMVTPMFPESIIPKRKIHPQVRGILSVHIIEARSLPSGDVCGSADPFVKAHTVPLRQYQTRVLSNTSDPKWDEVTHFRILEVSQYLYLEVFDHDWRGFYSNENPLCRVRVGPLSGIPGLISHGATVDEWFDLGKDHWTCHQDDGTRGPGKGAGEIRLKLSYTAVENLRRAHLSGLSRKGCTIQESQAGILFGQLLRAVNTGEGRTLVKIHCNGAQTKFQSREQAARLASVGSKEHTSEVAWLESFSFFDVQAKETVCLEVLKQSGKKYKSFAWVDIPLALVADPKRECRLDGLFSLEGMPSSCEFHNAALDMELEWVPLNGRPIPNMAYHLKDLGTLHVRLCNARGLPKMDVIGSVDPFVEFTVGSRKRRMSSVVKSNRNPEWMEMFTFQRIARGSSLLVTVKDYSSLTSGYKKSKFVGDVSIPMSALMRNSGCISGTWKLQSAKKGSICMDLIWEPCDGSELEAFIMSPEDVALGPAVDWPASPVEELVPPFAFSRHRWDVEAHLVAADISELGPKDGTQFHCYLHLKDIEHKSKAKPQSDLRWDEHFRWQAVQCSDTLDVTLMAGLEPLGICRIELHDGDRTNLDQDWEFDGIEGTLKMTVRLHPAEVGDSMGSSCEMDACLNITLIEVCDLVAKDLSGYSDPYCRLKINDQIFKSTTKFNTLHAVYEEYFQFLDVKPDQVLEVLVYDYDRVGSDEHLGHAEIPLFDIISAPGRTIEDTWDLQQTTSGTVRLRLQWLDNPRSASASPEKTEPQRLIGAPHVASNTHSARLDSKLHSSSLQQGTLTLSLHAAKDLPKAMFGSVNAYVKATMQNNKQEYKSTIANGCSPVWEDTKFSFQNVSTDDVLTIRVADKQAIGKTVTGFVTIKLHEIVAHGHTLDRRLWPIISQTNGQTGMLDISLLYEV